MGFDKEAVYDEQIFPLMAKIIDICKEHGIPHIASFYLADAVDEDEGPLYCSTCNFKDKERPEFAAAFRAIRKTPEMLAFTIRTEE